MNSKRAFFVLLVILALPVLALAEEKQAGGQAQQPPFSPEEMAKITAASTPNENHKVLDALAGEWNHTAKFWMKPDGDAMESSGTTSTKWILGGHFLQSETKGSAMGMPFEGIGITGYDNLKKEYNTVWIDNMATGMMTSSSQYDAASKTFTEKGSFSCPMTGETERKYRGEIKIADNDHYTYTMYTKDKDGTEFKSMEIAYTRK